MKMKSFSPKQMRVLCWWCRQSPYRDKDAIICDGAVRSGKTICMGLSFILWAFYRFEGKNFAICGKTIRTVKRNLVMELLPVLQELGFACEMRYGENQMILHCGGRTNRFYFFGGKDESSAGLIQGITLAGLLLDEVVLMPRSFVEQALARCSETGAKFWFSCNPESPGHWFYTQWIRKAEEKNALYVHFTMADNPALSQETIQRYRSMFSGPFYQRFVEGKWVQAEGLVYPFMGESMYWNVPEGGFDSWVISMDYGTVNPTSAGLWGRKEGVWYRVEEYYYASRETGISRTDEEHYEALRRLVGGRKIAKLVVDPSAASFLELVRRRGEFPAVPAENNVENGIRLVSSALKTGAIRICRNCTGAIREFGLYRWKDNQERDLPVKENDHAMDEIRYFVSSVLREQALYVCAVQRREARGKEGCR